MRLKEDIILIASLFYKNMDVKIESTWKEKLSEEFEKEYFSTLAEFVKSEYQSKKIFPPPREIFSAFEFAPFENVKVVILGQDPYHGDGQAHGLCFSVKEGVSTPPSLVNIYKEIVDDVGGEVPDGGNLSHWAKQGVLLLNATLTVEAHKAGSHQGKGWEEFTDAAIKKLAEEKENLVFILWGSHAQKKGSFIDEDKHLVIKSPHPSPLSAYRGFFGSKPFSKTNAYLAWHGKNTINWLQ